MIMLYPFTQPDESKAPPTKEGKMMLCTSKSYAYDDEDLVEVLAATINKMYRSGRVQPTYLTSTGRRSDKKIHVCQ